jgi:uncharacterized protein HemY
MPLLQFPELHDALELHAHLSRVADMFAADTSVVAATKKRADNTIHTHNIFLVILFVVLFNIFMVNIHSIQHLNSTSFKKMRGKQGKRDINQAIRLESRVWALKNGRMAHTFAAY